ncbi:MAG: ABC transporter substrate-binding protein [Actinomycetota bacterium]|nr:ABC transporter substrate-binding protein [Actinomycetota bacterium]
MPVRNMVCAALTCTVMLTGCASMVPPGQFVAQNARADPTGASAVPGAGSSVVPSAPGVVARGPVSGGVPGRANIGTGSAAAGRRGLGGQVSPVAAISAAPASCHGFTNSTGISASTISLGNVADVSGPVPGLFASAQQATMAYAAYFNATSSICGRKLKVVGYDSQTSATGDQQAATSGCDQSFALVGSVSAFDSGGAKTVADCGIPDLRTISTTPQRVASRVSFGTDAVDPTQVSTVQYQVIKSLTGDAYTKSAILYLDAGAAIPNATAYRKTMESLGYHFVYDQAIDVTALSYATYAAKIKSLGVRLIQFEGSYQFAVRLKQALVQQGVDPVFVMDSVAYDPIFVAAGGADLDGMYSYVDTALFEESGGSPALQLYVKWLRTVAPSAQPSFFGMFAWGAMQLFSRLAVQLGGRLSRDTLLAAIAGVHDYTADGLFAPQDVGGKHSPSCQAVIQLESGTWVRRSQSPYSCSTVFDTTR